MPRVEPAFESLLGPDRRRSALLEEVCGSTRRALLRLEPLPETRVEIQRVAATFGGDAALVTGPAFNDAALKQRADLGDYRVLYFATHALLPAPDACLPQPALVTALGPGDSDALLDAGEILDLKLDADLVVLAACDTGGSGGGEQETGLAGGGEALGGLARAMIYAGARSLIVSHWAVDSDSAAQLMTRLFSSGAANPADGLAAAERALMADPATSHPYFWAPFTVVGDGARPLSRPPA
jgi:CHAT domain-containing protein